ncbi:MAG TPA: TetR family transcriptional regulator [Lachnospiraceae bacterium]|nr:TetR family transcriptional regulator [Lachnospiraceae bacterium]
MKYYATTYLTKAAIGGSLKELLNARALNKISVSEICKNCGISRKTFYYHFTDIYDIVSWLFEQEIGVQEESRSAADGIRYALQFSQKNRGLCRNLMKDAAGYEMTRKYLKSIASDAHDTLLHALCESAFSHVPDEFKEFLIDYYSEGFSAYIIKTINGKELDVEEIENAVCYLTTMMEITMPAVLQAMELRKISGQI